MKQLKPPFIKRTGPALVATISIKMLISQNCSIKKIIFTFLFCFSMQFTTKASEKYWDKGAVNIDQFTREKRKKNEEEKKIAIKSLIIKKGNIICPKCKTGCIVRWYPPYHGYCDHCSNYSLNYACMVGNFETLIVAKFGKTEEELDEKFIAICETCNTPCTQSIFPPGTHEFNFDISYWSTKCTSSCTPFQHTKENDIAPYSIQSTEEIIQDKIERVRYLEKKYTTNIDCKQCNKKLIKEPFMWKKTNFSILRCPNFAKCKQAYEVLN